MKAARTILLFFLLALAGRTQTAGFNFRYSYVPGAGTNTIVVHTQVYAPSVQILKIQVMYRMINSFGVRETASTSRLVEIGSESTKTWIDLPLNATVETVMVYRFGFHDYVTSSGTAAADTVYGNKP